MSVATPGRRHWMKARAGSRRWLTRFVNAPDVHLMGVSRGSGAFTGAGPALTNIVPPT